MKQILLVVTIVACLLTACSQKNINKSNPACLEARIEKFKTDSHCKDANVKKYTFQKQTVYVFSDGSCGADMASPVIDASCKELGMLGGFVGNTQINGEHFSKNAVFVETVWQK